MKTSEKIYSAISIVFAAFCLVAILNFQLFLIPRLDNPDTIPLFNMVCAMLGINIAALAVPAMLNLKNKKLGTVPTVIQIVFLMLMAYGIPIGIWGIVLLVKSKKRSNQPDPTVKTPGDSVKAQGTQGQL